MVYIKRLTIQGFKSFGSKKTSIDFEKGLVVITGPNGGGKSNILDAVRFALGELSAHNLRVGKMSELIHDNHPDSGARVSLTLDNFERILPVDSSEVTITRRLDKTGESEYLLNGKQISRAELLTILSMSNIRPSGFNIVSQGSVTSIAEMSGVELRKIIEDISGIGEYERKKQEAEEQLKIAEKNIAIAKAGTAEVKLRVNQLQRERNEAYRRRHVENILSTIKSIKLNNMLSSLKSELSELDSESTKLEEEIANIENTRGKYLDELSRLEVERSNLSNSILELERKLREIEKKRESIREREVSLASEESKISERLRNISSEIADLEERLKDTQELRITLIHKIENEKARFSSLEGSRSEIASKIRECREQLDMLRARLDEVESRIKDESSKRNKLEKEIDISRVKVGELEKKVTSIDQDASSLSREVIEKIKERRSIEEKIRKNLVELEELEKTLDLLNKRLTNMNEALVKAQKYENLMSSLLQKITSSGVFVKREINENIKNALKEVEGVYGFLDDWIDVKDIEAWRKLESGTSGWIYSLIVEDWITGVELARVFSQARLNIKIIPLEIVNAREHLKIQNVNPRNRWAKKVLTFLLDEVVFSKELKRPERSRRKIVDPQGIVAYPDGRIEVYANIIGEDYRIIEHEYHESIKYLELLRDVINELREDIGKLEEEKRKISEQVLKLTLENKIAEENLHKLSEDITKDFLKILLLDLEKIKAIRELVSNKERLEQFIKELSEVKPIDYLELNYLREEKEKSEERLLNLSAKLKEVEVEWRESSKLVEEYSREYDRLSTQIDKIRSRLEEKSNERRVLEEKLTVIVSDRQENISELQVCSTQIEDMKNVLEEERKKLEEINLLISKISSELRNLELTIQEISNRRLSIAVRRSQLESEIKKIKEELESLQVYDFPDILIDRIEELERELVEELSSLEKINQLAPQQYEELIQNYKVRSMRIRELEEERAEIMKFIGWLEEEKKKTFMHTFNKVSESFERYFSILTGGQAWLKLEDLENPLNGGIEMILRFPGKSARSSRSASGGEKSVSAVALLLALQGLTPADFYIFDEVDAHMDIQYSIKLAELFSEMSKKTQIIVITLKDVIAEKSNQLIGVYMRNGESRVVKTKIEEVLENV